MNGQAHQSLSTLLDNDEAAEHGGDQDDAGQDLPARLQEEHEARLRAEALSEDQRQRLAVHSEQVAEYAQQKAIDLSELQKQANELQALLASAVASDAPDAFAVGLKRLFEHLGDASADAAAFAAQSQQDAKRHKIIDRAQGRGSGDTDEAAGTADDASDGAADPASQAAPPIGPTADSASTSDMDTDPGDSPSCSRSHDLPEPSGALPTASYAERARYIPMRLTLPERRLFRLLEAALMVSDYTDKVDVLMWKRKDGRITQQVKDICSILSGLVVAQDYRAGQELIKNRDFKKNEAFFAAVFEVGRRYKIMNPDRMRATYGKLLYMLMDTARPAVQELLEFDCIKPLSTVASFLEARGAGGVLADPLMAAATAEIVAGDRPRAAIQADLARKEAARKALARRHQSSACSADEVLEAVYSFSDNNTYLLFNRDPVDRMIGYLRQYFEPRRFDDGLSLAISSGRAGARLSHNHERQYAYVLQSLSLWSEIAADMFRLWYLSEADLLSTSSSYRLCDTGQGLNRVQAAPRVSKAMHAILGRCQARLGSWVGSSVVHLGDHNVPNALMFIDKYTQVPRILNPLVQVLDDLPRVAARDPQVAGYVERAFGGVEACRRLVCADFFRHAFDGSGADNFFDAGSCIDGRLTSAWNWCSKLEKKAYYPVFKLCGFVGFDGDFK